jgi:hypothetical protein
VQSPDVVCVSALQNRLQFMETELVKIATGYAGTDVIVNTVFAAVGFLKIPGRRMKYL